jgi:hypothetical protein
VKEETHFTVISNADIKELTYSLHSFSSIVVEIDGIIQANESHAHCMEVRYIIQNDYYPLRYAFFDKVVSTINQLLNQLERNVSNISLEDKDTITLRAADEAINTIQAIDELCRVAECILVFTQQRHLNKFAEKFKSLCPLTSNYVRAALNQVFDKLDPALNNFNTFKNKLIFFQNAPQLLTLYHSFELWRNFIETFDLVDSSHDYQSLHNHYIALVSKLDVREWIEALKVLLQNKHKQFSASQENLTTQYTYLLKQFNLLKDSIQTQEGSVLMTTLNMITDTIDKQIEYLNFILSKCNPEIDADVGLYRQVLIRNNALRIMRNYPLILNQCIEHLEKLQSDPTLFVSPTLFNIPNPLPTSFTQRARRLPK